MKTFTVTATLLSLLTLTSSAPTQNLAARTPGNVFLCTGENFSGECETILVPFYKCLPLPSPFYKNVGSMRVDPGAFCRITYSADTCTLHGDAFINPTPAAPTLHQFVNVDGVVVDAGSSITSLLCQGCSTCT